MGRGVCGDVCAVGVFQVPANCSHAGDCSATESCCNWDNAAGAATNGFCGEVCSYGAHMTTVVTSTTVTTNPVAMTTNPIITTTAASSANARQPGVISSGAWQLGAFTILLIIAISSI